MSHPLPEYSVEKLEAEPRANLPHLTKEDAFELGSIAAEVILEWELSLAVDVVIGDELVYRARFKNTHKGNDEWLAGKANVVRLFGESSLLVRRRHDESGAPFDSLDLDHASLKAFGGSIPLYVNGEIAGTITTSGEADVVDHEACAEAVKRYLATLG